MNRKSYRLEFLLFCLLLLLCAFWVHAQSGRRQPKPPAAAPVPTPTPEPTPSPKTDENKSDLAFLVATDRHSAFASFPLAYYDAALRGCIERLRSGSSARVDVAQTSMNRGEAIKKAKAESTAYVVLLLLELDRMARSYDDLELDYVVFAPVTAKVVTSGTTYPNVTGKGPIVVGPTSRGSTSGLYREQLIRRAGEDAAERILKRMNLKVTVPK